jgi:hypothetical protein
LGRRLIRLLLHRIQQGSVQDDKEREARRAHKSISKAKLKHTKKYVRKAGGSKYV